VRYARRECSRAVQRALHALQLGRLLATLLSSPMNAIDPSHPRDDRDSTPGERSQSAGSKRRPALATRRSLEGATGAYRKAPHPAMRGLEYGRRCPSVALRLDPRPD
jgi:hypothetical protein